MSDKNQQGGGESPRGAFLHVFSFLFFCGAIDSGGTGAP
jgi:hypothetical protein